MCGYISFQLLALFIAFSVREFLDPLRGCSQYIFVYMQNKNFKLELKFLYFYSTVIRSPHTPGMSPVALYSNHVFFKVMQEHYK